MSNDGNLLGTPAKPYGERRYLTQPAYDTCGKPVGLDNENREVSNCSLVGV